MADPEGEGDDEEEEGEEMEQGDGGEYNGNTRGVREK